MRISGNKLIQFASGFVNDPLAHWPFVPMSRTIFGNTAGARQNLYGHIHKKYCTLKGAKPKFLAKDEDTIRAAKTLKDTGFVKLDNWLDSADVAVVSKKMSDLVDQKGIQHDDYLTTLHSEEITKSIPEIFNFMTPKIQSILEDYFNSSVLVHETSFRRTFHIPQDVLDAGEVYSNHWHCDTCPISEIAMFVILSDVTPDDGPTAIIDRAATREMIGRGYKDRRDLATLIDYFEDNPAKAEMTGQAGTVLIAETSNCLHRAGVPAKGRRRDWLEFRLYPTTNKSCFSELKSSPIYKYTHELDY